MAHVEMGFVTPAIKNKKLKLIKVDAQDSTNKTWQCPEGVDFIFISGIYRGGPSWNSNYFTTPNTPDGNIDGFFVTLLNKGESGVIYYTNNGSTYTSRSEIKWNEDNTLTIKRTSDAGGLLIYYFKYAD